MPAVVFRIIVGMGPAGIVVVARVCRIDGDEGQVAQIVAFAEGGGPGLVGLGDHVVRECIGDAVLVDCNQRNRPWGAWIAQPLDHLGARQAQSPAWSTLLCLDKFAIFRAARMFGKHLPFLAVALVDGKNAPALGG